MPRTGILHLIQRKHGGSELSAAEIRSIVQGALGGRVGQAQLAALLMAVCYEGLSYAETLELTRAFVDSGAVLRWDGLPGPVVDKHSTGGVGDKVSLALLPWLAALGLYVPKLSGRGLGHTGGTVDKLESIPGFRSALPAEDFAAVLCEVGCVDAAQSAQLVPADKLFYSLRDATDTVDQLGLIAASVMSKKLAAGAQYIVLDVKCGSGAFFATPDKARQFAALAMRLGRDCGRRVGCVISSMAQPLGHAVGNALEVAEVLRWLDSDVELPDVREVCCELGAVLLLLCGRAQDLPAGRAQMLAALASGAVRDRFRQWISAQGGDLAALAALLQARTGITVVDVRSPSGGYITGIDTRGVGELARRLGAGRQSPGDSIAPLAGLECLAKLGSPVVPGDIVARAYLPEGSGLTAAKVSADYSALLELSPEPGPVSPVVLESAVPEASGMDSAPAS